MATTRHSYKPRSQKPKSIAVNGRRWFHRGAGNTYFTAAISVNGEHVHTIPMQYGYGDYYLQAAGAWLAANGYAPGMKHYASGGMEPLWHYCADHGCALTTDVVDVTRKSDLHGGGR